MTPQWKGGVVPSLPHRVYACCARIVHASYNMRKQLGEAVLVEDEPWNMRTALVSFVVCRLLPSES
jgi:hypothetical protein